MDPPRHLPGKPVPGLGRDGGTGRTGFALLTGAEVFERRIEETAEVGVRAVGCGSQRGLATALLGKARRTRSGHP